MGVDFIYRAAQSFRKGLDRSRIELGTPDLFRRNAIQKPRSYALRRRTHANISLGDNLGVRYQPDGTVVALRGIDVVADIVAPPDVLVQALQDSHGEAFGVVEEWYEGDVGEISIC